MYHIQSGNEIPNRGMGLLHKKSCVTDGKIYNDIDCFAFHHIKLQKYIAWFLVAVTRLSILR